MSGESQRDSRSSRDVHKTSRDSRRDSSENTYRDKSRDRDRERDKKEHLEKSQSSIRDHSRRQDNREGNRRECERSQTQKEDAHSRSRGHEDKIAIRNTSESNTRQDKHDKPSKFQMDDPTRNKEQEPQCSSKSKVVPQEKEKPTFELSGKLLEDTNTVDCIVIKYMEPPDSRKPNRRWALFPYKGAKLLPTIYVDKKSVYMVGTDREVADIPLDHPSCCEYHAALQYRLVPFEKEGGDEGRGIRPYLIDLGSDCGTYVNHAKLEPRRFYELKERDLLRFGYSPLEYVLLPVQSKDDSLDDDVPLTSVA